MPAPENIYETHTDTDTDTHTHTHREGGAKERGTTQTNWNNYRWIERFHKRVPAPPNVCVCVCDADTRAHARVLNIIVLIIRTFYRQTYNKAIYAQV